MATASSPLPLVPHGEIVRLNVGGTIFETTLGTLTEGERVQGSRLQATFTQQTNLDNATYGLAFFINADPAAFTHILRWIKHGRVPSKLRSDEDMRDLLLDEARDLNLTGLIDNDRVIAPQAPRRRIGVQVSVAGDAEARVDSLDDDGVVVVLGQSLPIGGHELTSRT